MPGHRRDRPPAVRQAEHDGRCPVEAVGLLALEVVDDQLVGDILEEELAAASLRIRPRHRFLGARAWATRSIARPLAAMGSGE